MKKYITLFILFFSGAVYAEEYFEKLNAISEYAEKICNSLPLSGEQQGLKLNGKANAELTGLLKKITDLGVSGEVVYSDSSFKGVVQEDLKDLFISNADCKNKVSERLEKRILPAMNEESFDFKYGALAMIKVEDGEDRYAARIYESSNQSSQKQAAEKAKEKCQKQDPNPEGCAVTKIISGEECVITYMVPFEKPEFIVGSTETMAIKQYKSSCEADGSKKCILLSALCANSK